MNKATLSRREFLKKGGKYAALAPASTILISKSARAGGSVFMFSDGRVVLNEIDCFSAPNGQEANDCLDFFLLG